MKVDPIYTEAVLALMARPEEFVPASALAPIVKMHPSVIIEYAKNGKWPFCKYVISGNHVKFARIDFLKHFGFIVDEEPEEETEPEDNSRDTELTILQSLMCLLQGQSLALDGIKLVSDGQVNLAKSIIETQKILLEAILEQNEMLRQILQKSA